MRIILDLMDQLMPSPELKHALSTDCGQGWVSPAQEAEDQKEYFRLCDVRDDLLKKLTLAVEALKNAKITLMTLNAYGYPTSSEKSQVINPVLGSISAIIAAIEKGTK